MINAGKEPAPGFLMDWFRKKVDEAIAKHGLKDPSPVKLALPPDYDNPRNLPAAWLDKYLHRKPEQLAFDVIRAHDANFKLKQENRRLRKALYILSLIVSPIIGEVVKLLLLQLFK